MAKLIKYTGIVFVLMLLARGSGFIRNLLVVNRLNVGVQSDAFFISVAIIDFFILLSGLNAMKSVATTTFTQERKNGPDASEYLSSLLYVLTAYGLLLSIPLLVAPGFFIRIFAPGFDATAVRVTSACLRILAILVLCKGLLPILEAFLGVQRRFAAQNMFMPIINFLTILVVVFGSQEHLLRRFCIVFTVSFAASCVASFVLVAGRESRLVAVRWDSVQGHVKRFARLSYPLLFATTAYSIAGAVDRVIASYFQTGVITSLGVAYSMCFMTVGVLLDPIWKVLFPHFTALYVEQKHEKLGRDFNRGQLAVALMFIPVSLFFVFFSTDVISAILLARKISAQHVVTASRILSIYGLALIFNAGLFLPSYLLQSAQKNSYVGRVALIAFAGNIVCSIVFSLRWGYIGIPLGTLVAFCAYFALLLRGVRKHIGICLDKSFIAAALGAACVSMAAALLTRLVVLPARWFAALPSYAYPIATCATHLAVYFACVAAVLGALFRRRIAEFVGK